VRPRDDKRHPLVVLSHGAWGPAERRREPARLDYAPLSTWLAARGFAVLVPMRRGYGASEGEMAESSGGCAEPDYTKAALVGAQDILAGLDWLRAQPFADAERVMLVGFSAGGWATLGAASRKPAGLGAVINLAGGRGGFPMNGWPCAWERMRDSATAFGAEVRVPSLWLYGRNDALFGPEFAAKLADAWRRGGAPAELHVIAPDYADGHGVFMAEEGVGFWGPLVERFLAEAFTSRTTAGSTIK
jgi:dienelactone hydrolase